MKTIVFDTSTIISLVTNNLLESLIALKMKFDGEFYIPKSVAYELVNKPLEGKMFKLEALIVNRTINDGTLRLYNEEINVDELLNKYNNLFYAEGKPISVVSKAEVEALALAIKLQADAYAVDERTMRLLIEDPLRLKKIQENKLHMKITMNKEFLDYLTKLTKNIRVIRSTELMLIAYELGLLDQYLKGTTRKELLDALLWGLKLRGCSISNDEVNTLINTEK